MSGNIVPTKVALIHDPRLELENTRVYGVLRGGNNVSFQRFQTNSSSNSNIQITCNPPSAKHVVSRRVFLHATFTLTFTGTTTGPTLLQSEIDGPRAYPLSSVITNQAMTLGSTSVSLGNFNQWFPALLRYDNSLFSEQPLNYGGTPSMMDFFQNYGDALSTTNPTTYNYGSVGTQRNPLGPTGANSVQDTRAGFAGMQITDNSTTSATVILDVIEPIFISPFIFQSNDSESGLTGISEMTYTASLGDLTRLWSQASTATGASEYTISPSLTFAELQFTYLEPSVVSSIPTAISWPYFNVIPSISQFTTSVAAWSQPAPFTTMQLTNNNLQLIGIPRRVYIFAQYSSNEVDYTTSDTFMRLLNLSVQFDAHTYLASASEYQLWQISNRNGSNISWSEWQKYTGSVMCLEFGTDIGMNSIYAPGVLGTFQFQVTGTFANINQINDIHPTLYIIPVYEGTLSVVNGQVVTQSNVLTNSDVLNAQPLPGSHYQRSKLIYGGDFFGSLKNFFSKGANAVKQGVGAVSNIASQVLPFASLIPGAAAPAAAFQQGLNVARALTGQGIRSRMRHAIGGAYGGARRGARRLIGRGFDGGAEQPDECEDDGRGNNGGQYAEEDNNGGGQYGNPQIDELPDDYEEDGAENSGDAIERYIASNQRR